MEILCVIILLLACEKLQFVVANPSLPRTLNESSNTGDICTTPVCVKSAQEILARMNGSIDPCDNFYKFACGNFISTAVIAKDREEVNEFTILNDKVDLQLEALMEEPIRDDELEVFQKVKIFYKNCMNTEKIKETGMHTIKDMFEDFGGWPVLKGENWNSNSFDWKEIMYKLNDYGFGADHFIQLLIYTDIRNNSKRVIYIGVPEFCLEDEFLKKGKEDEVVRAYYENMIELSVAFGAAKDKAKAEMNDVLDFEISLANHTLPSEQRRNKSMIYNNFTIADLQSKYSTIPWLEYINTILPEGVQVDEREVIVLTEPKYFTNLEYMLKTTSKR